MSICDANYYMDDCEGQMCYNCDNKAYTKEGKIFLCYSCAISFYDRTDFSYESYKQEKLAEKFIE